MIEAIFTEHELNQKVMADIDKICAEGGKKKHEEQSVAVPQ